MNTVNFKEIPIMEWGNNLAMKGMYYEDKDENGFIVPLLQKTILVNQEPKVVLMNREQWDEMLNQIDRKFVTGIDHKGEKMVLSKGRRQIDSTISWKVYKRDEYKCRYCAIDHVPLTVDHIVLWENGGATHEDNLVACCRKCNRKRGNLNYRQWLTDPYYTARKEYLTADVIAANELLGTKLDTLPTVLRQRKR